MKHVKREAYSQQPITIKKNYNTRSCQETNDECRIGLACLIDVLQLGLDGHSSRLKLKRIMALLVSLESYGLFGSKKWGWV